MIHMTAADKAKLYLAMTDALGVSEDPQDAQEAQRLALAQIICGYSDDGTPFSLAEAFRLGDALDYYLTEHAGAGPWGFSLANVSRLVGGDRDIARAALRLLGARPVYGDPNAPDDWSTAPGERVESVRFPRDVLTDLIQIELEEAKEFAA